jgi:HD-GYP domain-containing protein (c-di-GMP phosphodiesterase class II)
MRMSSTHEKPLYNSLVIDTYLRLIKSKYPQIHIPSLLSHAQMKSYEVADQGHWFTQSQVDRFCEKLVHLTGNEKIAREAGRYAGSPDAMGVIRQYLLGLIGPANAFKLIGRTAPNLTRSAAYESTELGPNKVQVTATPLPGVEEKPYQCQNRIGFWEALVTMLGHANPKIDHPFCLFKGDKNCTYIVSWDETFAHKLKKVRRYLTILLTGPLTLSFFSDPVLALTVFTPVFLLYLTTFSLYIEKCEKEEILKNVDDIKDSTEHLLDQINRNYNNALTANEIGRTISSQTNFVHIEQSIDNARNINGILKNVIQILQKRLDYDRGLILLANPENSKLIFRAGYGYSAKHQKMLQSMAFHLDDKNSNGLFVSAFHKQEPLLVNNPGELEGNLSPRSVKFARALEVKSFICCPIICDGEAIGILAVDNIRSKRPLINSDLTLLMGIAPVIGVSILNANLLNARRQQFHSILQVLAKTIDARDPLTAGHSEKVTDYAMGICRELGQPQDFCEMLRVAALLHDYGKIAVPDSILKKPAALTEEEYLVVKTHTQKTREILDQINFEGIYKSVPEIAGAHHEKLDGSGYPNGLRESQIPLGARILAVADFFEAITARRHYREPMPLPLAFELLRERCGSHFDAGIVDAFIRFFEKNHPEEFIQQWRSLVFPEHKCQRISYKGQISYTVDGTTRVGICEDISARGIYVASGPETIDEGSKIKLSFSLPGKSAKVIETFGRVAWVNSDNLRRKKALPAGFGVEFVDLKGVATDTVFSYVLARQMPI